MFHPRQQKIDSINLMIKDNPLKQEYCRDRGRSVIGRGGYSYICVLPDEFLLKSVVIKVDFKRNSSGRTQIYEYAPPPPQLTL